MSGLEWWAYETVKDLVAEAISVAQGFEQMMGWEEWEDIGQEGREKERSQEVVQSNSTEILRRKKIGKLLSNQPSIVSMFKKLEEKKNKTANIESSQWGRGYADNWDDLPSGWSENKLEKS